CGNPNAATRFGGTCGRTALALGPREEAAERPPGERPEGDRDRRFDEASVMALPGTGIPALRRLEFSVARSRGRACQRRSWGRERAFLSAAPEAVCERNVGGRRGAGRVLASGSSAPHRVKGIRLGAPAHRVVGYVVRRSAWMW
ncbi:MAG: hypothetical protein QOE07_1282, partial [Acidimicrobiaceae bacterium]|nr:hypothetical protein [Acidimicrobiaceae bacterium]